MRLVAATALLVLATAGVAGEAGSDHRGSSTALLIVVRDGTGGTARAKLYCGGADPGVRGFLRGRSVHRLCERASRLAAFLATPPDPNRMCTQVYGGPQTARIRGHVHERPVDRRFHRRDGCGIGDWRRARALLGGEPPASPGN